METMANWLIPEHLFAIEYPRLGHESFSISNEIPQMLSNYTGKTKELPNRKTGVLYANLSNEWV